MILDEKSSLSKYRILNICINIQNIDFNEKSFVGFCVMVYKTETLERL